MGLLPIGFFSPLPLAMMIPFMATQSLAMGEAFGKSFQYGKRKISSMTNDEFNRYTFADMMNEQTANIKLIIPKLHEQMEASQEMQKDIFDEMIKLIPTFIDSVIGAITKAGGDFSGDQNLPTGEPVSPFGSQSLVSQSDQSQSMIVNVSHSGQDTTLGGDAGTGATVNPAQQKRINFRNEIKNWNKRTTEAALAAKPSPYEPWQIQMLEAHLRELINFENPSKPPPPQKPLTPTQEAQKAYLTKKTNLLQGINTAYKVLDNIFFNIHNSGLQDHFKPILRERKAKYKAAQKLLINYLTISKNNLMLKSVANKDWNDRIWQQFEPKGFNMEHHG